MSVSKSASETSKTLHSLTQLNSLHCLDNWARLAVDDAHQRFRSQSVSAREAAEGYGHEWMIALAVVCGMVLRYLARTVVEAVLEAYRQSRKLSLANYLGSWVDKRLVVVEAPEDDRDVETLFER